MARAHFKLLSEIKEITEITVITIGIHSLRKLNPPESFDNFPIPEKTKPPEGGLSPKKQSDVPNG